ncbi:hypothetical protein E8E13_011078 [Curvularia kusanoi]|uniref:BTB domain-containing protein n=1 Tax=Curvularia kusanoi TaxID=90978 RepID=A0A9P4WEU7_CURKU|nr:hypothetical protein E8E13_011078 [Curvularia kusanoi]
MSRPNNRSMAQLFNSPTFSDIVIKQIYKGKAREYYAHKAILCVESSYFRKAFTGNFKESHEAVMEIHDDDPDHFELLLKYVYTYSYDETAVDELSGGDTEKRLLIPIGIHAVADKYDIPCIAEAIAQDLRKRVSVIDDKLLNNLLDAHYATAAIAGGPVGEVLTAWVLKAGRTLTTTEKYKQQVISNPVFGADMALALSRDIINLGCGSCKKRFRHAPRVAAR